MTKLTAVDLFCGAGGLSEGLRQAGFRIVAANDFNKAASETFRAAFPESVFFEGGIQDISVKQVLSRTGLRKGELDLLAGGPPCQGYSIYNHKRSLDDLRTKLYREYIRLVDGLRPKWIVMENVTGMLTNGAATAKAIIKGLKALGYNVEYAIHRAEDFGVPQERRRVLFIGNRIGAPLVWPTPTHGAGRRRFTTVGEAIGDLPPIVNGGSCEGTRYAKRPTNAFQKAVRLGTTGVVNHKTARLGEANIKRMSYVPQGGSWRDIPHKLLPEGMKTAKRSDHTKRYGRLREDGLSSTILTKADVHWGTFYHPTQDRVISVREAARLQSFPDRFVFEGSVTEQYVQIGNAVPPMLAKAVGVVIANAM